MLSLVYCVSDGGILYTLWTMYYPPLFIWLRYTLSDADGIVDTDWN